MTTIIMKLKVAVLSGIILSLVGCSSWPPPHTNSFFNRNEEVKIEMLTLNQIQASDQIDDWCFFMKEIRGEGASGNEEVCSEKGLASATVDVLAPVVINYVSNQLAKTASYHEQKYMSIYLGHDFWVIDNNSTKRMKYNAIKITRKAEPNQKNIDEKEKMAESNEEDTDSRENCSELIYGLVQDNNGFIWIAPIFYKVDKSKAKVNTWLSTNSKINSTLELAIDSVWIDKKGIYHRENVGRLSPFVIKKYDIAKHEPLHRYCDTKECLQMKYGIDVFLGVPISEGEKNTKEAGVYWLTVQITEQDASKAKDNLLSLSTLAKDKKKDVADWFKD